MEKLQDLFVESLRDLFWRLCDTFVEWLHDFFVWRGFMIFFLRGCVIFCGDVA